MANTNEALVYGWSVQQLGNTVSQTGYAYPGVVPTVANVTTGTTLSQQSVGAPSPIAGNVTQMLINPGYADGQTLLGTVTSPSIPASGTGIQNPYGLAVLVTVTGGTVSAVATAPWATSLGAATFTTINPTGETGTSLQVTVPGGGFIKLTYSVVPTSWTWITTN